MIYIISNSNNLKKYLEDLLKDEYIEFLNIVDIYNVINHKDNLLIINLDIFDNIQDILDFLDSVPTGLKVMALRNNANLAEGTLLVKKGVKSYCQSNINRQTLLEVIQVVKDGNSWVYPELMNYIIKQIHTPTPSNNNVLESLTAKESEVALLVASGNSNQEIANSLKVALVTVKKHIGHIFEKLDVKDRVSLSILVNS